MRASGYVRCIYAYSLALNLYLARLIRFLDLSQEDLTTEG